MTSSLLFWVTGTHWRCGAKINRTENSSKIPKLEKSRRFVPWQKGRRKCELNSSNLPEVFNQVLVLELPIFLSEKWKRKILAMQCKNKQNNSKIPKLEKSRDLSVTKRKKKMWVELIEFASGRRKWKFSKSKYPRSSE